MKYIVLIIGLLVMGCGKQEKADTAKPVKELTLEEKVVGTYEDEDRYGDTYRTVLLENGVSEYYENGKKVEEGKWSISKEGEMHIIDDVGDILVLSINKDESITYIAEIKGGKREDYPAWVKIPAHPLAETMKKIK
jgi:hypothetical protein